MALACLRRKSASTVRDLQNGRNAARAGTKVRMHKRTGPRLIYFMTQP